VHRCRTTYITVSSECSPQDNIPERHGCGFNWGKRDSKRRPAAHVWHVVGVEVAKPDTASSSKIF
jgi:hypothetical protein